MTEVLEKKMGVGTPTNHNGSHSTRGILEVSTNNIISILQSGFNHQERIAELKKLSIERLVDLNNTIYTMLLNGNPIGIKKVEADLLNALSVALESSQNVHSLDELKVAYLDRIGWRKIRFLGIVS